MLAAAVNARKRLFVQKAGQVKFCRRRLKRFHCQLVMVGSGIARSVYGSNLMLSGRHFVMLGFGINAQFPKLIVKLLHKRRHFRLNGAEIMVFKVLSFGGTGAQKRSSAINKVGTLFEYLPVYKKIFLLGANGGNNFGVAVMPE